MQIPYLSFRLRFPFFTLNLFLPFLFVSTFAFSPLSYLFNVYIYIYKTLVLPSPLILSLTLSFFFFTGTRVTFTSPFSPYFSWIKDSRGLLDPVHENHSWKQVFNPATAYLCNSVLHLVYIYTCIYTHIHTHTYISLYIPGKYIFNREKEWEWKMGSKNPRGAKKKKWTKIDRVVAVQRLNTRLCISQRNERMSFAKKKKLETKW